MLLEFSPSTFTVPKEDQVELQRRLLASRWPNVVSAMTPPMASVSR
jgi:hypothetical protein